MSYYTKVSRKRLLVFAIVIVALKACGLYFTGSLVWNSRTIRKVTDISGYNNRLSRKPFSNNREVAESFSSSVSDYGDTRDFEYETCLAQKSFSNKRMFPNSRESLARFNCSHLMTISDKQNGRLGTAMFRVASLIGLATWHGYTPVFNSNVFLFNKFELMNIINSTIENSTKARERICCAHDTAFYELDNSQNWSLSGYLQSWKYFDGAEERVRKAFTFKGSYTSQAMHFLDSVRKDHVVNVCVHSRRGDVLKHQDSGYVVAPALYFQRAMQFCRQKFGKVQFIFVCNDKHWCKTNFKQTGNYFSSFTAPVLDMALLASCDHVIMTSGTFGWWGAWLAGGTTIYYRGHPKEGSRIAAKYNVSDFYPKTWIGMY